jgi:hypothetical protein
MARQTRETRTNTMPMLPELKLFVFIRVHSESAKQLLVVLVN